MFVIGLTGGICCGKSSIIELFSFYSQNISFKVINVDQLGHQTYLKDTNCYKKLIKIFTRNILTEEELIDRKKLGTLIFNNNENRRILNEIVWPEIRQLLINEINLIQENDRLNSLNTIVMIEAAVLIEAGWHDLVHEVWVVESERYF